MLKRNWGLFVAIGVSLAVSAWLYATLQPRQPNLPTYEHSARDGREYQAGGSACQPSVLTTIRDRREAARQRDSCAEKAEQHRLQGNDLIQQARAADAAQSQAWAAYDLGWLGLYGTIGGFLTLVAATAAAIYAREAARQTEASAREAKRSADAASGALGVSRTQMRAYVNVTQYVTSPLEKGQRFSATVMVANKGQTPAYHVRVRFIIAVRPLPLDPATLDDPRLADTVGKETLAPGEALSSTAAFENGLPEADLEAVDQRTAGAFIFGYIKYLDVFNIERTTAFRAMLEDGVFASCEEGNTAD